MKAHEAAAEASKAIPYPLGVSDEDAQLSINAYNESIDKIISTFRSELALTYAASLTVAEQDELWKLAQGGDEPTTWEDAENAYALHAAKR